MKFREDAEYYLVEGWFDKTNGINSGVFYGACCLASNPSLPVRVAIYGKSAAVAAERASRRPIKFKAGDIIEINEMVSCGGIADRPAALTGSVNMVEPEVLLTRNEKLGRKKKKPKLPHDNKIGPRIPTISQSGGRLGGNQQ